MRHTVLFLPSHSVIGAHKTQYSVPAGVKQAVRLARALKNDINCLLMVPKDIQYESLEGWDRDKMMAIPVDLVRDPLTGAGTYSEDLHKYLTTRRSPLPYDLILNWNTQMTVGMQRMLRDGGYGGTEPAVITFFELALSEKEWRRNPAGDSAWLRSMEILEAYCASFGPCVFSSPYNAQLFKVQMRRIMSPAYQRTGLRNVYHKWRPESPPSIPHHHKWQRSKPFYLMIAGGFGNEREGIPKQAEVTIDALKKLNAMGEDIRLIVCSTSAETEWTKKVLRGAKAFVDYYHLPDNYHELWMKAHVGVSLRELDDGPRIVFTEYMMSGKPLIWLNNKYSEGWTDPGNLTPFYVESVAVPELVTMILQIRDEYKTAAQKAYTWACDVVYERHSDREVRASLMPLIDEVVKKSEGVFNGKNFKVFEPVFKRLDKKNIRPVDFDTLFTKLNEACGKSFGMYSRLWVAKMLKRYAHKEIGLMPGGRKLWVTNSAGEP